MVCPFLCTNKTNEMAGTIVYLSLLLNVVLIIKYIQYKPTRK